MITVNIPSAKAISYPIFIGSDLLNNSNRWLPEGSDNKKIVVITDNTVKKYYAKQIKNHLLLSFSAGEKSKKYRTVQYLQEEMLKNHCDRETLVLAVGGGVVGDVAGFVAATYLRGVSYIQIPTTLLAMVDSSVGGKTGIDTPQGKNLIGAFWQPAAVIADMNCLKTLPQVHLVNGLVESLKMFLTSSIGNFQYAEKNMDNILSYDLAVLKTIIQESVKIKAIVVSEDEKEKGLRMILNFGHTIGHAIEKVKKYTILHGRAVALGILVEAKISQLLGHLTRGDYEIIQMVFLKLGILGKELKKMNLKKIIDATRADKKVKSNQVRYVLIKAIGQVYEENHAYAHVVSDEIVRQALIEVSL